MKDPAAVFAIGVMGVLGIVALVAPMALLNGWAIATLWGWFVVPLGVKVISFAHAFGLSLIVSVMTTRGVQGEDSFKSKLVKAIMLPIVAVLFGWISVQFM